MAKAMGERIDSVFTPIEVCRSPARVIYILDTEPSRGKEEEEEEEEEEEGSPLRPIFCLKKKDYIKDFEESEDCFILDFNPFDDTVDLSNLSVCKNGCNDGSPDITLIYEKGQVACRDYPHSRHLCVKHPFEKTPHESHCELCYCYVCDVAAPCKKWSGGVTGHCDAIDNEDWKIVRKSIKQTGTHSEESQL